MPMKKFINEPENLVQELLEGYTLAYPDKVKLAGSNLVVRTVPKAIGKVGIVTLGGSGHEPGLSGFVGEGMLDISVPGEIFAAPGAPRCLESIRMAERGAGVLMVVLNHPGDVLTHDWIRKNRSQHCTAHSIRGCLDDHARRIAQQHSGGEWQSSSPPLYRRAEYLEGIVQRASGGGY
jgi:dihydroxyacetone kinase